ncbi:HlyD family efflux transporter periplasmic adaptor subunit [Defluviimonas salinarum]|uniref:HlyD family efflux transporter periplasmic adaptor subunit n=1 Tax=Defluviimonas salinarum TaxID=2992147 RepID=A0ABT3J840_9RHOB|nr:HlyD family efflux transporter periplasmic adaptor subunit [Defluviimonas salinarum]MCW3783549.1 HlyD family efflux transporter periplasmic adaptor subunit [Defluviimonas salinarum]
MIQLVREARERAVTELGEVTTTTGELTEQIISTQKQLERVEIRAPAAGYVHDMQVVTLGGVVPPGGVIAQIVSHDGSMDFELQVAPASVDQVHAGQEVRLRFSAFDQMSTPELAGTVGLVSATTLVDKVTGIPYYLVTAHVAPAELARLKGKELVPGMPVEAFISTGERSAASYLVKPLRDQMARAFRED